MQSCMPKAALLAMLSQSVVIVRMVEMVNEYNVRKRGRGKLKKVK